MLSSSEKHSLWYQWWNDDLLRKSRSGEHSQSRCRDRHREKLHGELRSNVDLRQDSPRSEPILFGTAFVGAYHTSQKRLL